MTRFEAPVQAGSRDQAQDLLASLPTDLSGRTVVLDCERVVISTPSFLDEIVKMVLVERHAEHLDVVAANDRTEFHVRNAAANRGVASRVQVALRI